MLQCAYSMSSAPASDIPGLIELARRDGVELRPTLVRVLTDLYVQEPVHRPVERDRFAELAGRLLDNVDTATRAAVAERLANYPGTPETVAGRLARDEIVVADPILRRSPVLAEAELHAILDACGVAHAVAIGARANLPSSVAKRLRNIGRVKTAPRIMEAATALSPAPDAAALTTALARRYLATDPEERRKILIALPVCPPLEQEEFLRRIDRGIGERLERAALRQRSIEFAIALRESAGMPPEVAARIAADPAGDPLAAVCRALEIPFDITSRILLFLNPSIGASVTHVSTLARWFEAIDAAVARRLVAGWCNLGPGLRMKYDRMARKPRERFDTRAIARLGSTLAQKLPPQRAVGFDI